MFFFCTQTNKCCSVSFCQEVILKRAADLVEALYGLPHNNQVRRKHQHETFIYFSHLFSILIILFFCFFHSCRRSSWSVRRTSLKRSTASHEDTPSCLAPPTPAWWGSTLSPGSCQSTSPSPHRPIRVRCLRLCRFILTEMSLSSNTHII